MSLFSTIQFITQHPVNRDNKIASISRFLKWQIGGRLLSSEVVIPWVNGSKFFARIGEFGITGNIYTGLHEFEDMGFLLHFLRSDDLFVDVGANVGSYTLLASAAVGANTISFEPIPQTFLRFLENIRLNHLEDKVTSLNLGLGAESGHIAFTQDTNTTNHVLASQENNQDAIEVEVSTLDKALDNSFPALIKIDVEGYETPVLAGAKRVLNNPQLKALIIELNGSGERYGFDEHSIIETLKNNGFSTFSYDPIQRKLLNLEGKCLSSGNTLFLRDVDYIQSRLRSAPQYNIFGKLI